MGRDLCDHCGHELPNAAGPGLYCTNCGTPVNPPKPQPRPVPKGKGHGKE